LYEFTKIYSGGEPELIEGDVFQTIIPTKPLGRVTEDGVIVDVDENTDADGSVSGIDGRVNDTAKSILSIIAENPSITVAEIADALGKGNRTVYREISNLKKQDLLHRVGSNKSGYWEVTDRD
jgi:ATP-dependent DNA helicase RecG